MLIAIYVSRTNFEDMGFKASATQKVESLFINSDAIWTLIIA